MQYESTFLKIMALIIISFASLNLRADILVTMNPSRHVEYVEDGDKIIIDEYADVLNQESLFIDSCLQDSKFKPCCILKTVKPDGKTYTELLFSSWLRGTETINGERMQVQRKYEHLLAPDTLTKATYRFKTYSRQTASNGKDTIISSIIDTTLYFVSGPHYVERLCYPASIKRDELKESDLLKSKTSPVDRREYNVTKRFFDQLRWTFRHKVVVREEHRGNIKAKQYGDVPSGLDFFFGYPFW